MECSGSALCSVLLEPAEGFAVPFISLHLCKCVQREARHDLCPEANLAWCCWHRRNDPKGCPCPWQCFPWPGAFLHCSFVFSSLFICCCSAEQLMSPFTCKACRSLPLLPPSPLRQQNFTNILWPEVNLKQRAHAQLLLTVSGESLTFCCTSINHNFSF